MNKEELYSVWAPDGSVWSKWVKPVLFAYAPDATRHVSDSWPGDWGHSVPPAAADTGLVIDLDGPRGVFFALRMARKGYRPVPLYNACPREGGGPSPDAPVRLGLAEDADALTSPRFPPVVDASAIVSAIVTATDDLQRLELPGEAPPAFVLDWRRGGLGKQVRIGMFDNRSAVFASDFPSAAFLMDQGISTMVVISETHELDFDLAAVLREWKAAGIDVRIQVPGPIWAPKPVSLPAPSWVRRIGFWLHSHFTLQGSSSGGYGRVRRGSG